MTRKDALELLVESDSDDGDYAAVIVLSWYDYENSPRVQYDSLQEVARRIVEEGLDRQGSYSVSVSIDLPSDSALAWMVAEERRKADAKVVDQARITAIDAARRKLASERTNLAMLENHRMLTDLARSTIAELEARIAALEGGGVATPPTPTQTSTTGLPCA